MRHGGDVDVEWKWNENRFNQQKQELQNIWTNLLSSASQLTSDKCMYVPVYIALSIVSISLLLWKSMLVYLCACTEVYRRVWLIHSHSMFMFNLVDSIYVYCVFKHSKWKWENRLFDLQFLSRELFWTSLTIVNILGCTAQHYTLPSASIRPTIYGCLVCRGVYTVQKIVALMHSSLIYAGNLLQTQHSKQSGTAGGMKRREEKSGAHTKNENKYGHEIYWKIIHSKAKCIVKTYTCNPDSKYNLA